MMNTIRKTAFGYSTKCNVKCEHCVAAHGAAPDATMELGHARAIIEEMACCNVKGISFTAGEPFLFFNDILTLVQLCHKHGIYSRMVTNAFWAKTRDHSDSVVAELKAGGLSQLRISFSRWHQANINRENIINAAESCRQYNLDYFISFVTDFSKADDAFEQFLRDTGLTFFPEPLLYFGRAGSFNRSRILTDYQTNTCAMNPYLSPGLDMFACCDAGNRFSNTNFFFLGNLADHDMADLFMKYETHVLYNLIRDMGLTSMASFLGFKARDIVTYRKCELCEMLFNSKENLRKLEKSATSDLAGWRK